MPKLQVNGIDVNYEEAGSGEPLVLVHNLIANIHSYDFNVPVFSKYFRTIRYDLRGHGLSSRADSLDAKPYYAIDNLVEDLHGVLQALKVESCYLLGQAYWGVNIISSFYAKYPQMVKALMPVSWYPSVTRTQQLPDQISKGFERLHAKARTEGMMAVFEERKQTMTFWTQKTVSTPVIMSTFQEMYRQCHPGAFLSTPEISAERGQEIKAQLNKGKPPLLQIVGFDDTNPADVVKGMKEVYPGATAVLLPDAGHYPAIENPEDFNAAVLNFIAGVKAYK